MARSALTVAALVVAAFALATAQAKSIDFNEEDLASEDSIWALYERWAAHNTVARDPGEKTRRFPIFKKNARFIHEFNQGDVPNKLGLNLFGDMTPEEITKYRTGFRYPTLSDIRKRAVTYVKKQGDYVRKLSCESQETGRLRCQVTIMAETNKRVVSLK